MATTTADLRESIETLYAAFGGNHCPKQVIGCPCCHPRGSDHELVSVPLRQLAANQIGRYAFSACLTWGGPDEFRYFLPRILELSLIGELDWPNPEIVISRLSTAGWRTWPAGERAAIEAVFEPFWIAALTAAEPVYSAEDVLCALSLTGVSLLPFLQRWIGFTEPNSTASLLEFTRESFPSLVKKAKLSSSFWTNDGMTPVIDWLRSEQTAETIDAALLDTSDETVFEELGEVRELLEMLKRR